MLKPDSDRVDYGEELAPPVGYALTKAIGCTYSLDLNTLISIPISLGQSAEMIFDSSKGKLQLLDGLIKTANKIHIYCQKGKITVPKESIKLYSLLEESIYEVLPKDNSSFHPKLWIVRYDSKTRGDSPIYKVIVLSRNLTGDRSYDISMVIDGKVSNKVNKDNTPICNYVKYLNSLNEFEGSKKFINDLKKVVFDLEGSIFSNINFIPIIEGDFQKDLIEDECDSMLIISPFLSDSTLRKFDELSTKYKPYLFSRKDELQKVNPEIRELFQCYHIKDEVVDGEGMIDKDIAEDVKLQNIHSKIYIKEIGKKTDIYLGSPNCSFRAFNNNIEFLVKLSTDTKKYSVQKAIDDLIDEKYSIFKEFEASQVEWDEKADEIEQILQDYIREICKLQMNGDVQLAKEGNYNVNINITSSISDIVNDKNLIVKIRPLTLQNKIEKLNNEIIFEGIAIKDITSFFIISLAYMEEYTKEFVVKIDLDGIPENRTTEIVKSIINNKKAFLNYISFLLGDGTPIDLATLLYDEEESEEKENNKGNNNPVFIKRAMFEKLLKAASRNTTKIEEVGRVLEFLDDSSVVPNDFRELFENFKGYIKR